MSDDVVRQQSGEADAAALRGVGSPDEPTVITNQPLGTLGGSSAGRLLSPMELGKQLAGERLGHFELIEYAGGGGMGAVFRARDTMLNRVVALKVLSRDQAADDENRRRFQNEAQSAARLDHENIARVYYVGEDRGLNYIVFEFIDGVNVRELVMRRGPLPVAEAVSYVLQVADALAHAASRDVVHRDIKPSNILITPEGKAKLVDMGLARLHQVQPGAEDLTASGVTLGTFDYISPEQARDPRSADVRSDIYSLGCTMYFMLTGRPPFPEGTVLQKLLQHNSDDPPDPREFNTDLPEAITTVVRKMLAKDPRRRYQTPAELMTDLMVVAGSVGAATPGGRNLIWVPQVESPAWFERHLPWLAPAGALVALVFVLQTIRPAAPVALPPRLPLEGVAVPEPAIETTPPAAQAGLLPAGLADAQSPPSITPPEGESPPQSPLPAWVNAPSSPGPSDTAGGPLAPPSFVDQPSESGSTTTGAVGRTSLVPEPSTPLAPSTEAATSAIATPLASEPANTPADGSPLPPWLLVVGDEVGPQRYTSLWAACSEAKEGDVIELRYTGRRVSKPLTINVPRLTLRAGDGHQPVVVFRPLDADTITAPHGMITLAVGQLSVFRIALELDVPTPIEVPAQRWSLVELAGADALRIDRSTITIRNATATGSSYHPAVACFSVHAASGKDSMMMADVADTSPVDIQLTDCIVRGETALLRVNDVQPARLEWSNGLLAVSDPIVCTIGGQDDAPSHVDLSLRHITAALRTWAIEAVNSADAPYLPELSVSIVDSILLSKTSAPLVENVGIDDMETFQQLFRYQGDHVFYEGFNRDAFWRFVDQDSIEQPVRQLSFDQWKEYWGSQQEVLPRWGTVIWQRLPAASRPMHESAVEDYLLASDLAGNPALQGARDLTSAGMNMAALPPLPPAEPLPEPAVAFPSFRQ